MDTPVYDEFSIGQIVFQKVIQGDNYVRTTRYNVLTFIPLTLFENFKRFANIYFLFMAVIGFMPWSPVTPIVQITPLLFVLIISMIKSLIEDLYRYANDKKYNSIKFCAFRDGQFELIRSCDIRPGDILKLEAGRETPADILVLCTSESTQITFVNEVNLNGETAIKQKKALHLFQNLSLPTEAGQIHGNIQIPMPCNDLISLDGNLTYNSTPYAFSMRNCVLRGTFLEHTDWVIGVALYTGHNTRIIQNQRHPPHKISHLERRLNWIVVADFILNLALVFISATMAQIKDKHLTNHWIPRQPNTIYVFFQNFTAFAVIYSYMIPISMYVTIEFVRFFQRWTFSSDLGMYAPSLGFCIPNNSNLNEELGQVDQVFSDKTGTLTENIMNFVQISARGNLFDIANDHTRVASLVGKDKELTEILAALTLCHSVIISDGSYSSESPDEEALVTKAASLGAKFVSRVPDESITISLAGTESTFQHLATVEFDSDRKRMSVVVRAPNNQIVVYTKGADTAMLPLLSKAEDAAVVRRTVEQVDAMAEQGLRTLICGWRIVSEAEYEGFKRRLDAASLLMENRDQEIKNVGGTLEKQLLLLGAVAVEDQLQPNVPETISYLAQMGIKLWVLTGDKRETAISIAKSTNVVTPECGLFECLTSDSEEHARVKGQINQATLAGKPSVLVLSPDALKTLLENPEKLIELGKPCRSVVCFRMSPFLKSKVVDEMQRGTKKICLAIGDGANDVNMIQTASVGVGVIGREGRQAASNADFAISRFKHLKRLLAVHGRLSLLRLSGTIRYMIYKNLVFVFPQFWYFFYTNWTPTTLFDGWLLATYNLIWTIFPPGEYGFFEQDISFTSMMRYPVIYRESKTGRYLSTWRFILEGINALYQSLVLFFFMIVCPSERLLNDRGLTDTLFQSGLELYVAIVMVVDFQTMVRSHHWNVFLFMGVIVSILIFFLINLPYGSFPTWVPEMYFVPQTLFTMLLPYPLMFLSVVLCLAPEGLIGYLKGMWFPSYTRILREQELLEQQKRKFIV